MFRLKTIAIVTVVLGVLTLFKAFVLKRPVIFGTEIQTWVTVSVVVLFLAERDERRKKHK